MVESAPIPTNVKADAANAVAGAITGGQVSAVPSNQSPEQIIDIGINALAALTNAAPQALRQRLQIGDIATMTEYQRTMALVSLRQYADDHAEEIRSNLQANNLAAMSQDRRDAIRAFYAQVGANLGNYDTPVAGETEEQRRQRQAQAIAVAAGDRDPFSDFFMQLFLAIARALGIEDFANAIVGTRQPDNTPTGRSMNNYQPPAYDQATGDAQLDAIVNNAPGRGTMDGVVNIARALRGQREVGENSGPIQRATMGPGWDHQPWCGGFVRYCFDKMGMTGIYDQPDFRGAPSYIHQARRFDAWHPRGDGYRPKPGDVVMLNGNGHVGIVTDVDANGNITYIAGNDGDRVNQHGPASPASMGVTGFCDSQRIAERHRSPAPQVAPTPTVQR